MDQGNQAGGVAGRTQPGDRQTIGRQTMGLLMILRRQTIR
jgi:hypothetical protein